MMRLIPEGYPLSFRRFRITHTRSFLHGLLLCTLLGVSTFAIWVQPGHSGTIINVTSTVDVIADDGYCTLREAVIAANTNTASGVTPGECPAGSGTSADSIQLSTGTYILTINGPSEDNALSGDLDIREDLTLSGAGVIATAIFGGGSYIDDTRMFELIGPVDFGVSSLTLTGLEGDYVIEAVNVASQLFLDTCRIQTNNASGVYSEGAVFVDGCLFADNAGKFDGGGIRFSSGALLQVTNSTFTGNSTGPGTYYNGGAIYAGGDMTIIMNSTFSYNSAMNSGGAISLATTAYLYNVTVFGNTADVDGDGLGSGGGVSHGGFTGTSATVANSIIAGNDDLSPGGGGVYPDYYPGGYGFTSQGYNLIGIGNYGGFADGNNGDQVGTAADPLSPGLLPSLAYHGGPTPTHALQPDSPALNAGNPSGCKDKDGIDLPTDQRGFPRPNGAACDIGAYEYQIPAPVDFDFNYASDVVVFRGGAWRFFDYANASFDYGVWSGTSPGCIPAPMDYDGDGGVEPTQLCNGSWHFYNDNGSYNKGIWTGGVAGDLPVPADYDGDGTDEVVVWRNGAWRFFDFATGAFDHGVWTGSPPHWLGGTNIPMPMDYDGDGAAEFTVWSGGPWHFYNDNGSYNRGIWTGGAAGDLPVPADYDGDMIEEVVVWRGGAWRFFDFTTGAFDHGVWTGSPPHWLGGTSLPSPLDADGDGDVDFSVFSGGPWHFFDDAGAYVKGIWTGGVAGDLPISRRLLP